jgi:beta-phosphoglucomutase-like phosphatase (HAD superfamily)
LPDRKRDDDVGNTAAALDNREQRLFEEQLRTSVVCLDSAVILVNRLKAASIGTAVHSSTMDCCPVLQAVGLDGTFDVVADGRHGWKSGRKGKPDLAVLLEAAKRLRVRQDRCVVVEHTPSGIAAGRGGCFGMVVGVAPSRGAADLTSWDFVDWLRDHDQQRSAVGRHQTGFYGLPCRHVVTIGPSPRMDNARDFGT